jgi:KTSC domain
MPVDSAAVRSVGYDVRRKVLQVELTNGAVYDYVGVSQEDYEAFFIAQSKGQYYNWVIKPNYPEYHLVLEPATLDV